jgi:hypothetical protein
MTIEQLRTHLRSTPFRPFDVYVADGHVRPVNHPEMVAIPHGGRTIGVGCEDGTIETIDLLLVTSLKPRPTADVAE